MSSIGSRERIILGALVALAALFRFYRLDNLPPGFQFDQAFYVLDALKLLQGEFSIFFHQPGRSEPLFQYLLMPFVALFGADSPFGLKITGGIVGVLTIPLVYGITRTLFCPPFSQVKNNAKRVRIAEFAALFTAISFWHIFYSRFGERIPLALFMAILTFWFLWRAFVLTQFFPLIDRRAQWRMFAFTGLFTGLTLYTYPSGRVVPVAVVLLTAYAMLTDRAHTRDYLKGLALITAIAPLVFLPLGIYYLQHPVDFISHAAQVSIFVPHGAVSDDILLELSKNALKIIGMFFVVGDSGVLRNLPYRPVFDPLVGALFVIGVIVWGIQLSSPKSASIERLRAMFFAVWLGLAVGLSLVSDDAPNNGRILIGLPVVMILPAWGAAELWERLRRGVGQRGAVVVLGVVALVSASITWRDYFTVFADDPGTYYAFDTDKVEISDWLNQNAPGHQIFLAPLLQQNGTISLLTHRAALRSFESRDTIILPSNTSGKDALYVFPWEQEKKVQTMATRFGSLGARAELAGSNGGKLVLIYRVPAKNLPDALNPLPTLVRGGDFIQPQKIERAVWDHSFAVLGYSIDAADAAKRNLEVTLFFHALKPMSEDYTFSVKVRDAKDRVWGQEDKWAGSNSYAITQWSPGDVVAEKFYPGLNACAPAGEYRVTVEAYNPKTAQVLALSDRDGNSVSLGTTRADASPSNRLEDLEPDQVIDKSIGQQLQLFGYTLSSNAPKLGNDFSLSLFWRGTGKASAEKISVRLQDTMLIETVVQIPAEGRGVCSFFDLTVPATLQSGAASLWVNDFKLVDLQIVR